MNNFQLVDLKNIYNSIKYINYRYERKAIGMEIKEWR